MQGEESQKIGFWCFTQGDVTAKLRIDRSGYIPGDNIVVHAEIRNNSKASVKGSRVALRQVGI